MVDISKEDKDATRYYAAQSIYYSRYEEIYDIEYTTAYEWFFYCDRNWDINIEVDAGCLFKDSQGTVRMLYDLEDIADFDEISMPQSDDAVFPLDYGNPNAVMLAIKLYDRETGKKILPLDDKFKFNPLHTMTVKEAIELSVRYYRSFPRYPVEVKYEDVLSYNKDIITDELLNKESDLPAAVVHIFQKSGEGYSMVSWQVPQEMFLVDKLMIYSSKWKWMQLKKLDITIWVLP